MDGGGDQDQECEVDLGAWRLRPWSSLNPPDPSGSGLTRTPQGDACRRGIRRRRRHGWEARTSRPGQPRSVPCLTGLNPIFPRWPLKSRRSYPNCATDGMVFQLPWRNSLFDDTCKIQIAEGMRIEPFQAGSPAAIHISCPQRENR